MRYIFQSFFVLIISTRSTVTNHTNSKSGRNRSQKSRTSQLTYSAQGHTLSIPLLQFHTATNRSKQSQISKSSSHIYQWHRKVAVLPTQTANIATICQFTPIPATCTLTHTAKANTHAINYKTHQTNAYLHKIEIHVCVKHCPACRLSLKTQRTLVNCTGDPWRDV